MKVIIDSYKHERRGFEVGVDHERLGAALEEHLQLTPEQVDQYSLALRGRHGPTLGLLNGRTFQNLHLPTIVDRAAGSIICHEWQAGDTLPVSVYVDPPAGAIETGDYSEYEPKVAKTIAHESRHVWQGYNWEPLTLGSAAKEVLDEVVQDFRRPKRAVSQIAQWGAYADLVGIADIPHLGAAADVGIIAATAVYHNHDNHIHHYLGSLRESDARTYADDCMKSEDNPWLGVISLRTV